MKTQMNTNSTIRSILMLIVFLLCFQVKPVAQVTVYQYRQVPDDKIEDFIFRETTYWSKVAEKALEKGNLSFWGIFQKVGGYDLPNSSNFLFINTFRNIDSSGEIWDPSAIFPGVPMDQMETYSISKVTSEFFLHDENWAQSVKANPEKDFKYVLMNYQTSSYPDSFAGLEKKYWQPFIKKAMDNNQTSQVGWGDAVVLVPSGDNIKFTNVSYDLFTTLQDALLPRWDAALQFPNSGLTALNKIELNRRGRVIYRVVKVVAK